MCCMSRGPRLIVLRSTEWSSRNERAGQGDVKSQSVCAVQSVTVFCSAPQKLKEEGDRLSRQENAHAKTADRLVEVIIQAEETRERISAAGAGLKGIRKDLQEVTDELGVRFALEVETINK